ncbi:MAG TPA: cation transporter [Candidatus Fimimorpha faecalis]|uniref:Cation transporter n=1 Tax=Candidatus Fimimorpha faecalis TaxID=2840824 RepID=A0A9D1EES6_9FIRM|nr:cation transporter [Candidatus Fimimorpha faecalis]
MKKVFKVEDLDCAHCAAKLEDALNRVNGVNKATVNFLSQKITLDVEDGKLDEVVKTMVSTAKKIEPDCTILV